jgi:hypothetical protein
MGSFPIALRSRSRGCGRSGRLGLFELYANVEVQSHGELDEFAGAELRDLASQEITHVRLMNSEDCFQLRLVKSAVFDVSKKISPEI